MLWKLQPYGNLPNSQLIDPKVYFIFRKFDLDGKKYAGIFRYINDKSKEVLYTVRVQGKSFQPKVYSSDPHTVKVGKNSPKKLVFAKTRPVSEKNKAKELSLDPYL